MRITLTACQHIMQAATVVAILLVCGAVPPVYGLEGLTSNTVVYPRVPAGNRADQIGKQGRLSSDRNRSRTGWGISISPTTASTIFCTFVLAQRHHTNLLKATPSKIWHRLEKTHGEQAVVEEINITYLSNLAWSPAGHRVK